MFWGELLAKLDSVRSSIRQVPNFSRTLITEDHKILADLVAITTLAGIVEERRTVSVEIGPDGKPIIPAELRDIFATVAEEEKPFSGDLLVEASTRRIDSKTNIVTKPAKGTEMKTSMLPREDKHINRPPDLTEASKDTVAE